MRVIVRNDNLVEILKVTLYLCNMVHEQGPCDGFIVEVSSLIDGEPDYANYRGVGGLKAAVDAIRCKFGIDIREYSVVFKQESSIVQIMIWKFGD